MIRQQVAQFITVQCPRCQIIIHRVTEETVVYCIQCHKYCREIEKPSVSASSSAPAIKRQRGVRCN